MDTLKQNLLQNGSALVLIVLAGVAWKLGMPKEYVDGLIFAGLAVFRGVKVIPS